MAENPSQWRQAIAGFCALLLGCPLIGAEGLNWEWRDSKCLKHTLREAKVGNEEKTAIAKAISQQVGPYTPDMKLVGIDSAQQLKDAILETRTELVDLNDDGTPEVIAQGTNKEGCSPTGNCPFWVFQKSGQEYRLLVSLSAIQTFQIQRNRSGRFQDIVVAMHGSATERTLRLLQYSRGKYRQAGCYDANWSVLEGGMLRELKDPQLTLCELR